MIVLICPKCLSTNVHRSRRKSVKDHFMILMAQRPYRCHDCETRFRDFVFSRKIELPAVTIQRPPRGGDD